MKIRILFSSLLALALVAPVLRAQDGKPEHHTEIGKHMEKINKARKALSKQISDSSQNDSSLALVATIHDEAQACLNLKPEKEADLPADQQADFQAKFQNSMKAFLSDVDKLTADLKAGDNTAAATDLKGLLGDEKKDHKAYRKPHDE